MDRKKYILIIGGIAATVLALIIFNLYNIPNLNPLQTDDIIKEGNELYDKGQYENALSRYNTILFLNPNNYTAQYNKSNTYCKKKRFDLADSTYKNAAEKYLTENQAKEGIQNDEFLSMTYHNKGNANMSRVTTMDTIIQLGETMKALAEQPNATHSAERKQKY
mgnify:FL=1